MRLRRATAEDLEAVVDVFAHAREGMFEYLPRLHTPAEDRAFVLGLLGTTEAWVAEDDGGGVVGFASLDGGLLGHLYVHPRGRGTGSALLERVKALRPEGFELWVFQRNEGARRFYERHGLELVELTDGSANEEREPDARYEWRPRGPRPVPDPGPVPPRRVTKAQATPPRTGGAAAAGEIGPPHRP
jgi:GNAT superfamily N-acetyltransferase